MINIAICDDDGIIANALQELISRYPWKEQYSIHYYLSGDELISSIKKEYYDIIFMDIQLNDKLGTEYVSDIKEYSQRALIIYISFYDCYFQQLAQGESFRFLQKPLTQDKVFDALDVAYERILSSRIEYHYCFNGAAGKIILSEVLFIYSLHRKVCFRYRSGEEVSFYRKLVDVEKELENLYPYFSRANKSYLVNTKEIDVLYKHAVKIGDTQISVNPIYYKTLEKKFFK